MIDHLDLSEILSIYREGVNSAYNPKIMLKVLIFAYLSNVYSSRRIERLLQRDMYFMWLSGMKHTDIRTINYFRGKRPIETEAVFWQIKECGMFRRLRLRGLNGAKIEFGLKAIAHNLANELSLNYL